jgi:eukaryotic-like serine/threonine-protein kinase
MPDPAHKQIGDYEILRELGHGGMGQVYLVRNMISDRVEAMKVLLPDLAEQGDLANRFMREIKVLASLEHPNIAQLRTAFTAENQLVMIMEYVEGETLAERLQAGPFAPPDALNYTAQVLTALGYAHGKGVIHRDIKPSNMMLTLAGVVKLMDFGIARSSQDLGMTATGTTLGSLDYMSPEQVKSEPTDARSDLYSVGVSLYEMITGHRMFSATSSYSVMEAHVKEIPRPPIEVVPTLPQALSDMIMMAVAKDPGHRFQTADAMRNALSQVGGAAAAVVAPASAPHRAMIPPPQPMRQQTVLTPPPAPPTFSPPQPQPQYAAPDPRPTKSGGRHIGWIVVAAIVVLVALFGGTQVLRSRKQAPAMESAAAPSASAPASAPAATPTTQPAQPTPEAQPSPTTPAAPLPAPPPAPGKHGRQGTQQASMTPPPPPGPSPEEIAAQKKLLDDMENELDHLDSRAAAVESTLSALEQAQRQSGYGLRGDMVAARASMQTDLAKAKDALQSADTDRARKYLNMANSEIQKLEAFAGRR